MTNQTQIKNKREIKKKMCMAILVLKDTTASNYNDSIAGMYIDMRLKLEQSENEKTTTFLSIMFYRDFYTMKIEAENSRPGYCFTIALTQNVKLRNHSRS